MAARRSWRRAMSSHLEPRDDVRPDREAQRLMAPRRRRAGFCAAGWGRRDRHESGGLRLRRGPSPEMDRGRSRRLVRRRRPARHRSDHARHPLPGGGAPQSARARAHPRPRGSFRRRARSVAAAQDPGLCHAVHRGAAGSQAARRAGRPAGAGHHRAAGRTLHARSLRHRARLGRPFDPGIERPHHPHPARHRAPYRRLEDRSDAGAGAADRRAQAARARQRRLPGAGRRFHQCGARGPLALRDGGGQDARRADPDRARAGRGHHLRVPCRPPALGRQGGGGLRPRGRPGRPLHGADHAGRARDRLPRRHPGLPLGRRLRLSAARKGGGAVHRQPGRGARGAVAHCARTIIPR